MYESVIAEFLYPVGHVFGNDVVVDVYFEHTAGEYTSRTNKSDESPTLRPSQMLRRRTKASVIKE
jgi:hypothetical protein